MFTQPNAAQSVAEGFERGQRMRLQIEQQRLITEQRRLLESQAQQQAQAHAQQQSAVDPIAQALEEHKAQSWEAAKIAAAGDCAGAEAYALSVGNIVLAKQVKDYCGPAK